MPDLVEALSINRIITIAQPGLATPPQEQPAMAISRTDGLLDYAGDAFNRLLQLEWPEWTGARLPTVLQQSLRRSGSFAFEGTAITVTACPMGNLLLLRAARVNRLHRLTERELAVARLYGQGQSYKEIARRLGNSPATVRNFLQHIYAKLQIRDKVALAALVSRE